jgi:hypothetical protein
MHYRIQPRDSGREQTHESQRWMWMEEKVVASANRAFPAADYSQLKLQEPVLISRTGDRFYFII